jgi:hypothetical protein
MRRSAGYDICYDILSMRVLEARFHGGKKGDGSGPVLIGRVVLPDRKGEKVRVEAAARADGSALDHEAALAKLRFLVEQCAPDPLPRLLRLRSDFWSFVERR